jgi:hypothetical protein
MLWDVVAITVRGGSSRKNRAEEIVELQDPGLVNQLGQGHFATGARRRPPVRFLADPRDDGLFALAENDVSGIR